METLTGIGAGAVLVTEVDALSTYSIPDNAPKVQSQSMGVEFAMRSGTNSINYQDHIGLQTDFAPEIKATADVEALLVEGSEHVYMLYTFRSVGRAVPMVNDQNAENKRELNFETFRILTPQIAKMRRLMDFQEKGVAIIERCMRSLVTKEARERVVPDGYYDAITKVVDLLQKLDNLKDMKASLATDFSRYNRVLQALRAELPNGDQLAQEKHKLQLFLSNFQYPKSLIFHNLRDALKKIPGHEDVLIEMLQQNVDFIENERYLMLDEKYRLIRSLPHLMLLIDGDSDEGANKVINVFKDKRIKLTSLQAIFKAYPVVPECGDMSMTMLIILQRSPHWDTSMEKAWGGEPDRKVVARYSLPTHWSSIKSQHSEFLSRFSKMSAELATYKFQKKLAAAKYATFVSNLVVDGFKLLQSWTCTVLEGYHWKLTHPCTVDTIARLGAHSNNPYESAVRYNHSPRELGVIVDVISMIKSLSAILTQVEADVAPYLRLYVHHEVQQFVAGELIPPLHRAHKRKRAIIDPLLKLRRLVADWPDKTEPADDYVRYSRQDGRVEAAHKARVVGPSPTQLQFMRTMVRSMYDQRNQLDVGMFSKKDLEKEDLHLMETFYNKSLCFQYLLNYTDTLSSNSNLGDLWYREFYLELSGQIQFAIELSLPWILTEHVITNQHKSMPLVENILYTMDSYNDAANRSLYVLSQRFLYDEIEAEVNLVFDQLIFLISDHIYSYYKDMVGSREIDGFYRERLLQGQKKHVDVSSRRCDVPTSQRHIQVLGRVIDLNNLITQHINGKFYKDAEYCIKKFEASDLSHVIDFQRAVGIVRATHAALSEHFELDSFEMILAEVDEAVGPTAFAGRTMMHVLASLVTDIFPNYSYNGFTRRFVRSPAILKPIDRPKNPKADHQHFAFGALPSRAFEMANKLHRSFIGEAHIGAIVSILGTTGIPLIVNNLLTNLRERLEISKAYLDAITEGLPPCKLPKAMYGLAGCYGVFDALLKPILAYVDLKPEVFQAFKEVGNTLCFIRDMSDDLDQSDLRRCLHAFKFFDDKYPCLLRCASERTPHFLVRSTHMSVSELVSTTNQLHKVSATRERTSLFSGALHHLHELIDPFRSSWAEKSPNNKVLELEATGSFYRLWSALSFLFGVQSSRYDNTPCRDSGRIDAPKQQLTAPISDDAQFGHGFFVAGAALIHLLGQKAPFQALDFSKHVLRVEAYETATAARAQGVGLADATLRDEARNFVRLKTKHSRVYSVTFAMFSVPGVLSARGSPSSSREFMSPTTYKASEQVIVHNNKLSATANSLSCKTPPPFMPKSQSRKAIKPPPPMPKVPAPKPQCARPMPKPQPPNTKKPPPPPRSTKASVPSSTRRKEDTPPKPTLPFLDGINSIKKL
jgi:cytoplasmic FMR1 interacting protein